MNDTFLAAVFDMDGTLIASESIYRAAWERAAAELRLPLSAQDCDRLMGFNRADTLRELNTLFSSAESAAAFLACSEVHYDDIVRTDGHQVRPGIESLLHELARRRFPLAVATSTHRTLAEETLRSVGLRSYFAAVVTGDEVSQGKPHPEIYLRAAAALQIEPHRCLAFEDSHVGATAASSAGLAVVLIPELSPVDHRGIARVLPVTRHVDALAYFGAATAGNLHGH